MSKNRSGLGSCGLTSSIFEENLNACISFYCDYSHVLLKGIQQHLIEI